MTLRTIDLFCGGGGSSWGALAAGAEIVCGVDAWELAAQVYAHNFGEGSSRHMRMSDRTRAAALGEIGKIDLMLASPECTNHTPARGSRPQDEESKKTANYVLNFAEDLKPRWIVVENVVHMKGWSGYDDFYSSLASLGYHLSPQDLNAADFGVPQSRRRHFILCDREREPPTIAPTHATHRPASAILDPQGTWKSRPLQREGRAQGTLDRAERAIAALGRGEPFLIVYYGSDGSGGWQSLDKPLRTMTTLDRFGLVTWDGDTPMLRMLQPSELERAMGFTAPYKLLGQRREQIKLLGNGVTPPVMTRIVKLLTATEDAAQSPDSAAREVEEVST
jgi:DNA (cytosine-5)-methyltransferase 1